MLTPSGPYQANLIGGPQGQNGLATGVFFSGLVTAPAAAYATYPGNDPSIMVFGAQLLGEIFIMNTGSNLLVFQWREQWLNTSSPPPDHGVVLPGTTAHILRLYKGGVRVRGEGGTTTCYVWGV